MHGEMATRDCRKGTLVTSYDRIILAAAGTLVTVLFVLPPLWSGRVTISRGASARTYLRNKRPRAFWAAWSFFVLLALFFYVNAVYPLFPQRKP